VTARITLRDIEPDLPEPSYAVTVRYDVGEGARTRWTEARDAWQTFPDDFRAGAHDFIGAGHNQLFVTSTYGQVWTELYDLASDAKGTPHLRVLYHRGGSRVVVRPRRSRRGTYDLVEDWPKRQWEDEENLGLGRYNPATNYVRRVLHWDKKVGAFVPNQLGPSVVRP
jgi:hypothetical protein